MIIMTDYAEHAPHNPLQKEAFGQDRIWRMRVYRLSLELCSVARDDFALLRARVELRNLASQLFRATGSIGANIAEGYSRSSSRDRVRFFEYALGSAREAKHWYYLLSHEFTVAVLVPRLRLLDEIVRLLLAIIPAERRRGPLTSP
jgi:four helix bundle protein